MGRKMNRRNLLAWSLGAAIAGTGCLPALAADGMTPGTLNVFIDKPRLDDYADYETFLADVMEYRRQQQAETPAAPGVAADIRRPAPPSRRPESLQEALQQASPPPEPWSAGFERFGRTTPASFPLPELEGGDMATQNIAGRLQDMGTVDPEIFVDDTAREQADGQLADNPSNDRETREKKAAEDNDDIFSASYDPDSRLVTDSAGNQTRLPLFIDNEIDRTEIRTLKMDVSIFRD